MDLLVISHYGKTQLFHEATWAGDSFSLSILNSNSKKLIKPIFQLCFAANSLDLDIILFFVIVFCHLSEVEFHQNCRKNRWILVLLVC